MTKKKIDQPWRVPPRMPAAGRYRLGPEFPGCFNTGTRPIVYQLHKQSWSVDGQRFVVCHECDYREVQAAVTLGQARGKRRLPKRAGWHGDAWVFKTRGPAVACFEAWCERLQAQYDAMLARVAACRAILRDQPGTPDAMAAALELSDMGF